MGFDLFEVVGILDATAALEGDWAGTSLRDEANASFSSGESSANRSSNESRMELNWAEIRTSEILLLSTAATSGGGIGLGDTGTVL
jgi:hypothetical protein